MEEATGKSQTRKALKDIGNVPANPPARETTSAESSTGCRIPRQEEQPQVDRRTPSAAANDVLSSVANHEAQASASTRSDETDKLREPDDESFIVVEDDESERLSFPSDFASFELEPAGNVPDELDLDALVEDAPVLDKLYDIPFE